MGDSALQRGSPNYGVIVTWSQASELSSFMKGSDCSFLVLAGVPGKRRRMGTARASRSSPYEPVAGRKVGYKKLNAYPVPGGGVGLEPLIWDEAQQCHSIANAYPFHSQP
jgi:hypothetical protein